MRYAYESSRQTLTDGLARRWAAATPVQTQKKDDAPPEPAVAPFDAKKAEEHQKAEWAGKPFKLSPNPQFILWNLTGWRRADGCRRFRRAYITAGRLRLIVEHQQGKLNFEQKLQHQSLIPAQLHES